MAKKPIKKKVSTLKRKTTRSKTPTSAARVRRTFTAHRRTAYYAMGAGVLGLALLSLAVHSFLNPTDTAPISVSKLNPSATENVLSVDEVVSHHDPLAAEFQNAHMMGLDEKITFWSSLIEKKHQGRKKIAEAVGGHSVNDIAPLVPKSYDCTTFIETVAALSRSEGSEEFVKNLLAIRYKDGQASFEDRNHFPEADWIPNNNKSNILRDITVEIAQESSVSTKIESKTIDRGKWLVSRASRAGGDRKLASIIKNNDQLNKIIEVQLPYIPISSVNEIIGRIPNGVIINLVHKDDHRHPVLITHQGFIIRQGDQVLIRHASRGGRIRTIELSTYLKGLTAHQNPHAKWPLIGVNFNQIIASTSASSL